MTDWIKIKREELEFLLRLVEDRIRDKILFSGDKDEVITASHYLRINQAKIKRR